MRLDDSTMEKPAVLKHLRNQGLVKKGLRYGLSIVYPSYQSRWVIFSESPLDSNQLSEMFDKESLAGFIRYSYYVLSETNYEEVGDFKMG